MENSNYEKLIYKCHFSSLFLRESRLKIKCYYFSLFNSSFCGKIENFRTLEILAYFEKKIQGLTKFDNSLDIFNLEEIILLSSIFLEIPEVSPGFQTFPIMGFIFLSKNDNFNFQLSCDTTQT